MWVEGSAEYVVVGVASLKQSVVVVHVLLFSLTIIVWGMFVFTYRTAPS
jgi:hypothetical protein